MSDSIEGTDGNENDGLLDTTIYQESTKPDFLSETTKALPNAEDYKVYDNSQYAVERIRDRRESDFLPMAEEKPQEKFLTPLYVITAVFGAIIIIGPLLVKRGPNRGIIQACILLTGFCMWIFWFTIYFGQMNPLMGPRLENTTVAWMAYKIGKPFNAT